MDPGHALNDTSATVQMSAPAFIQNLPDELLIMVTQHVYKSSDHCTKKTEMKTVALVSKKFAHCAQEILFHSIDMSGPNDECGIEPYQLAVLFRVLLCKPGLGTKVRSATLRTYDFSGSRHYKVNEIAAESVLPVLRAYVQYMKIKEDTKTAWLSAMDPNKDCFVALVAGILSLTPNLQSLRLGVLGFEANLLTKLALSPSKPILAHLKVLDINFDWYNASSKQAPSFRGLDSDTSLLYLPSVRKLGLSGIMPGQPCSFPSFEGRQGISSVTSLELHGNFKGSRLEPLLKCFKGLTTFEVKVYDLHPASLENVLRVHQATLEHIRLLYTDYGGFDVGLVDFHPFERLRVLGAHAMQLIDEDTLNNDQSGVCRALAVAQQIVCHLPQSLEDLYIYWGYRVPRDVYDDLELDYDADYQSVDNPDLDSETEYDDDLDWTHDPEWDEHMREHVTNYNIPDVVSFEPLCHFAELLQQGDCPNLRRVALSGDPSKCRRDRMVQRVAFDPQRRPHDLEGAFAEAGAELIFLSLPSWLLPDAGKFSIEEYCVVYPFNYPC